jgi:hypothetical protein
MDMHYVTRVGIRSAFNTARELYPTETDRQCAERVAAELLIDVEAVLESVDMGRTEA